MHVNDTKFKITQVDGFNINKKEKYKIKNEINSILNVFSRFYVAERNKSFSSKLSFFIKKIFNLKTGIIFILDKVQHNKLNDLSTLFAKGDRIKFNNCKLINSHFVSFKRELLDSFFLSLNTAIKNDCHDNVKNLIKKYLYEKSQTKGDFLTIMNISLDVIHHYRKEEIEPLNRYNSECINILNYINFNSMKCIDTLMHYACEESDRRTFNKMGNSIMYLVNTMHDIYSIEMEKNFIVNITKCFIDKVVKYNVGNYNNEFFKKSILNLLINKLKNNEGVKEFVDNMLGSGVLEYEDIIKEKEKTAEDEYFISDYNRKIKNIFSENINSDEMKNNIAKFIRDNYQFILSQMKNKSNYLENERVLLDIIDCLKSDNDWHLNLL
ncbi:hypothetical protein I5E97_14725 [Proteus hauseri]|uniref:hypothetical protein n=1 Tax=Proteus cibi TaxID=2050966 RepID=UPI000D69F2FE|nr:MULTISPECIES: hypothetical protein [Proteus]MBG6032288.1 hypothetical protein [Proteus hauseri]